MDGLLNLATSGAAEFPAVLAFDAGEVNQPHFVQWMP